jgi:hypothetical protein
MLLKRPLASSEADKFCSARHFTDIDASFNILTSQLDIPLKGEEYHTVHTSA